MTDSPASSTLGELLRRQRELASIPMRQLARMSGGISGGPYLSQIERGLRAPSDQVLEALADNLQISADMLRAQTAPADAEKSDTLHAIANDPQLTPTQRAALTEVYQTFLKTNRDSSRFGTTAEAPGNPRSDRAAGGVSFSSGWRIGAASAPSSSPARRS